MCNPLDGQDPCLEEQGAICRRCDGNIAIEVSRFRPDLANDFVRACLEDENCDLCQTLDCSLIDPNPESVVTSSLVSDISKEGGDQCALHEPSDWLCSKCTCNPLCDPKDELCVDGGCIPAEVKCDDDDGLFCFDSVPARLAVLANKRVCKNELFVDLNTAADDPCACVEDCPCEDPAGCPETTGSKVCVDGCFRAAEPCPGDASLFCVEGISPLTEIENRRVCDGQVLVEVGD